MNTLRRLLIASALLLVAAPTQAAIIDFTDEAAWGGANGTGVPGFTSTQLYDGVSVTVASGFANQIITFNADDVHPLCGLTGLACDGDGLGIGDDEITYGSITGSGERILVLFSQAVDVTRFAFFDLYQASLFTGESNTEVARWAAITSGGFVDGSVTGTGGAIGPGLAVETVNLLGVVAMLFYADSPSPSNTDFSLVGIEMTASNPVPEPATLLLTGAGLAAAFRMRRRR